MLARLISGGVKEKNWDIQDAILREENEALEASNRELHEALHRVEDDSIRLKDESGKLLARVHAAEPTVKNLESALDERITQLSELQDMYQTDIKKF